MMKTPLFQSCLIGVLILVLTAPAAPQETFSLKQILELAQSVNPGLKARSQEIEALRAAVQGSKQITNPEFEVELGRARSHDGLVRRSTSGIALSQQLENPFSRHYRIKALENGLQATETQFRYQVLETSTRIKTLFTTILHLERIEDLARQNLESVEEIHRLIRTRADLGEVKELEAIKLEVEALRTRNELKRIENEIASVKTALNALVGERLPPDFRISGTLEYRHLPLTEEELLARALRNHPKVKAKQAEVEMSKNNWTSARWGRLPDFKLTGYFNDELDGRDRGLGISLDIPLWNFKSREIAEAEHLWSQREAELQGVKLNLSAEIRSRLNQLHMSESVLRVYQDDLIDKSRESLRISQLSYSQGEISLIDFLDSQRTHFSILRDFQESLFQWHQDLASLEIAFGEELQ